jgi:hypothetical protein
MTSHIIAQDVGWTPWSRLYLQAGVNYVLSKTETPASNERLGADLTQAILDARNNYWTFNFSSSLVVDDKTDLNISYFYYEADNYRDNDPGVPFGAGGWEHGVTATVVRRICSNIRVSLKYGYYNYIDQTSGEHNNYAAHLIYSSLQYRF